MFLKVAGMSSRELLIDACCVLFFAVFVDYDVSFIYNYRGFDTTIIYAIVVIEILEVDQRSDVYLARSKAIDFDCLVFYGLHFVIEWIVSKDAEFFIHELFDYAPIRLSN